jgi:deoxyribodipyrimidine photo-lyase
MDIEQLKTHPRVTVRKSGSPDPDGRCVVYWMQRAQRGIDNPALDMAVNLANELRKPVVVFLAPIPFYPNANQRHYSFLADGIPDIARDLARRGIFGFVLRTYPEHSLLKFCVEVRAAMLIGDENPLREPEKWRSQVTRQIRVPFWTVDADVIVPSRLLRREHYAARTIRPRLHELLPEFLVAENDPVAQVPWSPPPHFYSFPLDKDFTAGWILDRSVTAVKNKRGGTRQALRTLQELVDNKITAYPAQRSHPEVDGTSHLSPYLHFGHIGPRAVALAVQNADAPRTSKDAFLEQLIIRRELAVNFVRYNPSYDSLDCLEPWADRSLSEHAADSKPVIYSQSQLENAETHDPLWNAAQKQMRLTGWMHNYVRMYWAKKILEWSPSVGVAFQRAVWLNDRYELDGRDPNGYAGIAWAIVGKHDRPWFERPVFGKVRYMSFASTSRKFDCKRFIAQISSLERRSSV